MTAEPAPAAPPRGTRPRNRRALILAAATDLFYRQGYDQLSMSDLAAAVGIGPSAMYRHFAGKQQLLREVVGTGLRAFRDLLGTLDLTDRPAALRQLAAVALDHRELGVLWQREARHMTAEDRATLHDDLREIGALFADRLRAASPGRDRTAADLTAWAAIAALTSISFHRLEVPRPAYETLLAGLVDVVLDTDLPTSFTTATPSPGTTGTLMPASRREALLAQAARMFAEHGYTGVGIEDIGSAVGITGPSVYNHFPSKLDMLTTLIARGAATLQTELSAAYLAAAGAPDALRRLVRSYLRFVCAHPHLIDLLITETGNLPPAERHQARQVQHDYLTEWVHLSRLVDPGLDPAVARIRVHAVLSIANDAARMPRLHDNPALPAALEVLADRLLEAPL